jgi:hypothetical protein
LGSGLEKPSVDYNWQVQSRTKDTCLWIDQHRNFACFQSGVHAILFHQPRRDPFPHMDPFVNGFSKRDRTSNSQGLRELGNEDFDTGTVQTQSNARSQITAAP